ncbi:hypothetical protein ANN_08872 [Periplaneta americana]|uniref:HMG box domain-containing protein n=1 Tax=Periplaneta americana TaxID=6978 RepID=A0ABQ8T2M2_PERAM|nr:hypothetical protein ANN_08872 [Periplaneta americana]
MNKLTIAPYSPDLALSDFHLFLHLKKFLGGQRFDGDDTQNLISKFGWEQIDHPPYSPDLAPSDFHLLVHLKKFLSGQRFDGDDEVKTAVWEWFASQAGEFYRVLLKLDLPHAGTAGVWKLAEELSKSLPDWLGALQVEQIAEMDGNIKIRFKVQEQWQGWCAVYPDYVLKQYGVSCQLLEQNDICLPPPRLPVVSPDICDRFKRFSFPPEDVGASVPLSLPAFQPPDSFLSPPASPHKKLRDAERPKRPMNAFMLFAKRYRLELIQLHPGKDNR